MTVSGEPVFAPAYPIETSRLLLRPIDPERDVDALHAYLSREDVCTYIPPEPETRDEIAKRYSRPERIRSVLTAEGQAIALAVTLKETGRLIGDVVLFWHSAEHRGGEIGYVLNPDHHGKGYATETAEALLALAFDGLGLHRVVARLDQDNPASAAVARRLGMRHEATLVDSEWRKGRWRTELVFAMLEDEWRRRPGR